METWTKCAAGGSRVNIVPETVEMTGAIRIYDADVRKRAHANIKQVAENIGASANAKADVEIIELYDVPVNHARMASRTAPVLKRAADGNNPGRQFVRRGGRSSS